MTGREIIEQKMIEMGATKAQVNSKVLDMVIAILADPDNHVTAYQAYNDAMTECKYAEDAARTDKYMYERLIEEEKRKIAEIEKMKKDLQREREEFEEGILTFETQRARDCMRLAKVFKKEYESMRSPSSYDQNAYVKGIASILAGGAGDE